MPERHVFPRTRRLTSRQEFDRVFSDGEKVWGRAFICFVLEDTALESRVGLVVSRKVGCSVRRNKVKRMIREFFRRNQARFRPGTQLVVVARNSSAELNGITCSANLGEMLGRFFSDA